MNILLYGLGNIAHAIIANNKNPEIKINVYSQSNSNIHDRIIRISNLNGQSGQALLVTDLSKGVREANYILLCVPSHLRREALKKIRKYILPGTILGAFPGTSGFNEEVEELIPICKCYFSTQRVPFIARILSKGSSVESSKKESINICASSNEQNIAQDLSSLLEIKVNIINNFELINLTNSNPLLHTSRIYTFLKKVTYPFYIDNNELFYENWTNEASNILILMDQEFQKILGALQLKTASILEHYEVDNIEGLTSKLRNIPAFQKIQFPMKLVGEQFKVDFNSRYFIEDFELGLRYTVNKAHTYNIEIPVMTEVLLFYDNLKMQIQEENS